MTEDETLQKAVETLGNSLLSHLEAIGNLFEAEVDVAIMVHGPNVEVLVTSEPDLKKLRELIERRMVAAQAHGRA